MTGPVTSCQSCFSTNLESILDLGFLPMVNDFRPIGEPSRPFTHYPLELLRCRACELVQLGFIPPMEDVFPASYPYRSSTTRILRENFADLYREVTGIVKLEPSDLVIDIGGNDGNLLSNFTAHRTLNVTPEDIGKLGEERGIPHLQRYWGKEAADEVLAQHGKAKVVTATNVFAHVPDPHGFAEAVLSVLEPDGFFVVECHYLEALINGLQWDTIYAEHQRYYSVPALASLLRPHGLGLVSSRRIPTHGGSFRAIFHRGVGFKPTMPDLDYAGFARRVAESKRGLWELLSRRDNPMHGSQLSDARGGTDFRIAAIGAPSRASTLISYVGLDHNVIDYVCEVDGSKKLNHYMPGTRIPVVPEARLFDEQLEYALLTSWHIADELIPTLRGKGYRGKFVVPLPEVRVV